MKTNRYTEVQIVAIRHQAEGVMSVAELSLAHGMTSASISKWWASCGGTDTSLISQLTAMDRAVLEYHWSDCRWRGRAVS